MKKFKGKKILIANRGEIAIRIMMTAREMGFVTVAIYAPDDKKSYHVEYADEAYELEGTSLLETYLNIEKIVDLAIEHKCDAIHPGYGFLSENPAFAEACVNAGLIFVGPHREAIEVMGNKLAARELAREQGLPLLEGTGGNKENILDEAKNLEYPLLVKAAAGGGGKGMRVVQRASQLQDAIEATAREAQTYFGDGTVYVERYINSPRHIEVQVIGDKFGNVVHLFERECSIQRRHQKIIEESPSPTIDEVTRQQMGQAAVNIAQAIQYDNAGTVEFLVDEQNRFYFLEMNTRIQVEHPVTELVTGIDIVREQLWVAFGERLRLWQDKIEQKGHAIECRIYAEDPENNFLPAPGMISLYKEPHGLWVRNDSAFKEAGKVSPNYDPMISKLVCWGEDRNAARLKMINALEEYIILGIETNIPFLRQIMLHQDYIRNHISTHYCEDNGTELLANLNSEKESLGVEIPLIAHVLHKLYHKEALPQQAHAKELSVWQTIGTWRNIL